LGDRTGQCYKPHRETQRDRGTDKDRAAEIDTDGKTETETERRTNSLVTATAGNMRKAMKEAFFLLLLSLPEMASDR